jgi:hypothetical protein
VSWDTLVVMGTADTVLAHLRHGQLLHWGGAYPLLQAIPTFVLRAAGQSRAATLNVLIGSTWPPCWP